MSATRHRTPPPGGEGLSREELAVWASLQRTAVEELEDAARTCRIDTLLRLAGIMAALPEELRGDRLGPGTRYPRKLQLQTETTKPSSQKTRNQERRSRRKARRDDSRMNCRSSTREAPEGFTETQIGNRQQVQQQNPSHPITRW
jgi:hypothetical protein